MRAFYLLRHGETDWNAAGRIQGQTQSVPLNATGQQQAAAAAGILAQQPIDLIVSSTLDRAAMTAHIIAERLQCPVIYDKRLIERRCGNVEGLTLREIQTTHPDVTIKEDDTPILSLFLPKGQSVETHEELAERACAATLDLLASHANERLLLVSHGGWLKSLVYRLNGTFMRFQNALPYKAAETADGWRVEELR